MPDKKRTEQWGWIALILVGAYCWLYHAYIMAVFPDPLFEPDSAGYVSGPLQKLLGRGFNVPESRGLGYPLLVWTCLKAFGSFRGVLWFQHFLWMVTSALTVALFLKYYPRRYGLATVLLFIISCSPMGAMLSHSVLADAVYTAWQMTAIAGVLGLFGQRVYLNGIVAGFALAMAINTRPTGKILVLIIIIVGLLHGRKMAGRKTTLATLVSFMLIMTPFWLYNKIARHVIGTENFGTFYAVGDALKHLTPAGIKDARTRAILTPFYDPRFQAQFKNPNWIWYSPEGPILALKRDPLVACRIDAVYRQLITQALLQHPLAYFGDFSKIYIIGVRDGTKNSQTVPDKMVSAIFAVNTYYAMTKDYPEARQLLRFRPETAHAYFERIKAASMPPFDKDPFLFYAVWCLAQAYVVLSWAGSASLLWLLITSWRQPIVQLLFLTASGQLLMVAVGGVWVPRYGIPLEPLYALATFLALADVTGDTTRALRSPGSAKRDAIIVSDDFDAPLPDDILLHQVKSMW